MFPQICGGMGRWEIRLCGTLIWCCCGLRGAAQLPAWAPDAISVFAAGVGLQHWPASNSQSLFATVQLDSTWAAIGSRKQIGSYVVSSAALGARLDLTQAIQGFFAMGMRRNRWHVASIAPSNGLRTILCFRGRFPHSTLESRFVLDPAGFRSTSQMQHEAAAQLAWIRSFPQGTASVSLAWFNGGFTSEMSCRYTMGNDWQAGFVMNAVSGFLGVQMVWNRWGLSCQLIMARSRRFPGTSFTLNVREL